VADTIVGALFTAPFLFVLWALGIRLAKVILER
jgi:hypothetical protein